ncbi:unnamed protein product [Cuscuta epithymum]|uniref:BZIP domain-containing protein n=1 Tax=Cuscuta epithymum TaxID=186058 RepID=A0AAV0D3M2_9ASTE|nr:unnamed protein product [Cuscuta epithymum]
MDRVFSVDDIADEFWSPPPPVPLSRESELGLGSSLNSSGSPPSYGMMNRCSSDWNFHGFVQEGTVVDQNFPPTLPIGPTAAASSSTSTCHSVQLPSNDFPEINQRSPASGAAAAAKVTETGNKCADTTASLLPIPANGVPVDPEAHQAFLKTRLDLACAAVALTRANIFRAQDSTTMPPSKGSSASNSFEQGSQMPPKGSVQNLSMVQEEGRVPTGIPSLPAVQKKFAIQARSTSSGSEQSDDDEAEGEGEAETTRHRDPADVKRVRRMISNRESARRSRRRKQAHLTELDTQVSQLKIENTSLVERLTDVRRKYNEAAVDNRVLKADVETLRAKVKMAEQTVKRVTGLDPLFQAISDMSRVGMQSFASSHAEPAIDAGAALPLCNESSHNYYQNSSNAHIQPHDHLIQNRLVGIPPIDNVNHGHTPATSASMQQVFGLERVQNHILDK